MHKLFRTLGCIILTVLLSTGCEPMSYEEFSMPPYEGIFTWTRITKKAEWSNRMDHAGIAFDNKIWILGGYDSGKMKGDTYLEDIWSSTDGETWTLETENAPWKGRRGHSVNVFDDGSGDALFLIGGFEVDEATGYRQYTNDVWKSVDGVNWNRIKERTYPPADTTITDWTPRFNHVCLNVAHENVDYLYLIGGQSMLEDYSALYSMKYYNDIWRSQDGITWEKMECDDFGKRSELAAYFDPLSSKIYIHGGVHSVHIDNEDNYNHPVENYYCIWDSDDGENWNVDTSLVIQRAGHDLFLYKGYSWMFPGKTTSYKKFHMAWSNLHYTYRKQENGEWILDSEGSAFNGRHSYARVIFNDKVYVMGGETGDMGLNNDVWCGEINN